MILCVYLELWVNLVGLLQLLEIYTVNTILRTREQRAAITC